MNSLLIEGTFVNADQIFSGQIRVVDGLITDIGENLGTPDYRFDDTCVIFPGMGDIHIHAREDAGGTQNYKEDYDTCCAAASHGGVVHVAAMPNTPEPLINSERLAWHRKRVANLSVSILNYAGVGPGTKPLSEHVPYKVYTGPSVGPLFFKSETELRETLQHYRGKPVSFHVEDYDILKASEGKKTHDQRRPKSCVLTALRYVLALIEEFDLKAKLCHWSCGKESLELIKEHRANGFDTTIEVSPLHLYFDTDLLREKPELWPYVQMNPSLQSREDRLDLIAALKEGFIDFIATDHAPHTLDEKFVQFKTIGEENPEDNYKQLLVEDIDLCRELCCKNGTSGTPQLDTYAVFATWLIAEHGFTLQDIARVCCENPGNFVTEFYSGPGKFGKIAQGYYGSFTIMNLNEPTLVQREDIKSKAGWSPFEGVTFPGKLLMTINKGDVLYDNR